MTTDPAKLNDVTLAILAGGAGVRMGLPKAFLEVNGQPILSWLLAKLNWPGPKVLVTSKELSEPAGTKDFDLHVQDAVSGNGPLQGLLAAFDATKTSKLAVLTVDMPNIDREKITWLLDQLIPPVLGVMCRRDSASDQIEPFPSVFDRSAIEFVRAHLAAGRRSVHGLCFEPTIQPVVAPNDWSSDTWLNLNHPEQFSQFQSSLKNP